MPHTSFRSLGFYVFTGLLLCTSALAAQAPSSLNPTIVNAPALSGLAPDHVTLSVEDIDREADWYQRVLGFTLEHKISPTPQMIHVRLTLTGFHIDLIKYQDSKRPDPVDPLYLQQGWIHAVFHVDNLALTVKQLEALHVEAKEIDQENGVPTRILLRDPENNEIEITRSQP